MSCRYCRSLSLARGAMCFSVVCECVSMCECGTSWSYLLFFGLGKIMLPMSHKKDAWLIWGNASNFLNPYKPGVFCVGHMQNMQSQTDQSPLFACRLFY